MNEVLWVEKFRPKTISECILPDEYKATFQSYVNRKEIPHLLLCGGPGMGKTTIAKALCEEIECDYLFINGSDENGIDTFRTKIKAYASSMSLGGNKKVIIIDEADYLNANSIQPALRGAMEEFAHNCTFIMTCNFKNRLIEPLHSRCAVIDFKIRKEDKPKMASLFMKRAASILKSENVPSVLVFYGPKCEEKEFFALDLIEKLANPSKNENIKRYILILINIILNIEFVSNTIFKTKI
jgi:replication-associated recombination protein RarA